jgi:long-subunit fatty acid transport protein
MKLREITITVVLCGAGTATAGGLFLPGSGAVSTSRAGAAVASADDGEAIGLNPAGIAKAKGTTITFGIAAIDYFMSFQRNGTYPSIMEEDQSYEGQRYPLMTNDPKPPLGIGQFQPVPVIAIVSDLGGRIPGLHAGFGVYAPSAYPFRGMTNVNGKPYTFNTDLTDPPPPTRYDIMHQEAAVILPSVALAYRVMPDLDVGARFSAGLATIKSTVAIWGLPNQEEWVKQDGMITIDAKDTFVPTGGLGATYRPTPRIELGANYTFPIEIHAKGTGAPEQGPAVLVSGMPVTVMPVPDAMARCAPGGAVGALKACVGVMLPATATLGGRFKFLDEAGKMTGDLELDVDWEHWGGTCDYANDPNCQDPSDYRVTVDGQALVPLMDSLIRHGLQDTYSVRLGGSRVIPMAQNAVVLRGGISHDTAAAKPGWERADFDGAARTMFAAGASYKMSRLSLDAGFGFVYEGTRTDARTCAPTGNPGNMGCGPGGVEQPVDQRQGPDPTLPIIGASVQAEHPVNEGTFKSHYLMIMLGMSTWF